MGSNYPSIIYSLKDELLLRKSLDCFYKNLSKQDITDFNFHFEEFIMYGEAQQYLYLFRCLNSNYYKIGRSKNPELRKLSLQTGCPYEHKLIFIVEPDVADPLGRELIWLETFLHKNYKNKHIRGEWYLLNCDEIADIVFFIHEILNCDHFHPYEKDPVELNVYQRRLGDLPSMEDI